MAKDALEDLFNEIKEKKKRHLADRETPVPSPEKTEKQTLVNTIVEHSQEEGIAPERTPNTSPAETAAQKTGKNTREQELEEERTAQEPGQPSIAEIIEKETDKKLIEEYKQVKIYRVKGQALPVYVVPVSKPTPAEKNIILLIKEAATRLISISPYKIRDLEQRRTVYKQRIMEILEANPELHIPKQRYDYYADSVVREMVGYGPIDSLVRDDRLEEIMVIGPEKPVYVFHREHGMVSTNVEFYSSREIQDLINKIGREIGRRLDIASPLLDARLPDGSRVNATIAPASVDGPTLTIRKFREDPYSIIDLVQKGTITAEVAAYLWVCADGFGTRPANVLITGGTGSGKTTLLNVIMSFVPADERVLSIEDSVAGTEEIIVFEQGMPKKMAIGPYIDGLLAQKSIQKSSGGHESCGNSEGIETLCFDAQGKIVRKKIARFIRHTTKKKMFKIVLKSGRTIRVTEDHALFQLNENAQVAPVKTSELTKNDFIATPRHLPLSGATIKNINLLEHLHAFRDCYISGEKIGLVLRNLRNRELYPYVKIKNQSGKSSLIHKWRRTKTVPVSVFNRFLKKKQFSLKDATELVIRSKTSKTCIPAMFELDPEFSEFAGLWIADGWYDKNSVLISVQEKELRELVRRIGLRFYTQQKWHSDGLTSMINSSVLKTVMREILRLQGNSYSKRIPEWVMQLDTLARNAFLRGYFSGDGTVGKWEIEWTSCSKQLMADIQGLLLANGILSRVSAKRNTKDKSFKGHISGQKNIFLFNEIIGFGVAKKMQNAHDIITHNSAHHDITDVLPVPLEFLEKNRMQLGLQHEYYSGKSRLGRRFAQVIAQKQGHAELGMLAAADLFWDQIIEITSLKEKERTVYDLSVPEHENFICSNVFAHNTAELNLPLEHWIRLEARPPGLEGTGELTLDILTKNALRMRPDRIIVGEVRHDEAFTLFTAMNTGHAGSCGTVHANSPAEAIARLTSPPMNVPEIMLSGLDIIIVIHRIHDKKHGTIRRVTEIAEVVGVLEKKTRTNTIFERDPIADILVRTNIPSEYFKTLQSFTGLGKKNLENIIESREKLIKQLVKENTRGLKEVTEKTREHFARERAA